MIASTKLLFSLDQLAKSDYWTLGMIFETQASTLANEHAVYEDMTREQTVATARQTQIDVLDALHGKALAYDDNRFARGLSSC